MRLPEVFEWLRDRDNKQMKVPATTRAELFGFLRMVRRRVVDAKTQEELKESKAAKAIQDFLQRFLQRNDV